MTLASPAASVSFEVSAAAEPAPAVEVQASAAAAAAAAPAAPVPPGVEPAAAVSVSAGAPQPGADRLPVAAVVDVKAAGAATAARATESGEAAGGDPASAASRAVPSSVGKAPKDAAVAVGPRVRHRSSSSPQSTVGRPQSGRTSAPPDGPDHRPHGLPRRAAEPGSGTTWAPATARIADAAASIRGSVPAPPTPSFPHAPGAAWSTAVASGATGPLIVLGLLVTLVCMVPPGMRGGLVLLGTALGPRPHGVPLEQPG